MTAKRILLAFLAAGLVGWAIFAAMIWRASDIRRAGAAEARAALAAVRDGLPDKTPWLIRDAQGRFVRARGEEDTLPGGGPRPRPDHLGVLVWKAEDQRLVRTEIPFWFFRLKEISFRFMLKRAGVDMTALGLRPRDLARRGPGLVLDEEFASGDLLMIWSE